MVDTVDFNGIITTVTPDGRSGIVRLKPAIRDMEFVVISPSTVGRISIMNGIGRLSKETKVHGKAAMGIDALVAVDVFED